MKKTTSAIRYIDDSTAQVTMAFMKQRLLQHSSAATTQRYIGIEPQRIEQAIQNHARLI